MQSTEVYYEIYPEHPFNTTGLQLAGTSVLNIYMKPCKLYKPHMLGVHHTTLQATLKTQPLAEMHITP